MTREVYTDKRFIEFSRNYVMVRIFQDLDPVGPRLAARFRIPGVPTLVILNSSGREMDKVIGFVSAPYLIEAIKDITSEDPDEGRITI